MFIALQSRSHRHVFRLCALGMLLLQATATSPCLRAAPALPDAPFKVRPLPVPARPEIAPGGEVLARQAGLITGQSAALPPPKRELIQRRGNGERRLPARPSGAQLRNFGALPAGLARLGAGTAEDDEKLGRLFIEVAGKDDRARLAGWRQWVDENPASPWRPSVLASLGRLESERGYFSRAVGHLSEAWAAVRGAQEPAVRLLASEIAGDLALALARTGRDDEFAQFLKQMEGQPQYGTTRQKIIRARTLHAPRQKGVANADGGCAVTALQAWHRAMRPKVPLPAALLDTPTAKSSAPRRGQINPPRSRNSPRSPARWAGRPAWAAARLPARFPFRQSCTGNTATSRSSSPVPERITSSKIAVSGGG
jgi:hypothetical protein